MNLASVIRINAANHGDKTAILFGTSPISYAELWRSIEGLAAALHSEGIGQGDRIGLALRDHPLHLIAHYALARLGAVILPIDHRWTDREKKRAAETFGARLVVTDGEAVAGLTTFSVSNAQVHADTSQLPPAPDDSNIPLLISLSSGTTGQPKGAVVTHRNLYERFVSQWVAIGFDSRDCFAVVTPLFFGAGRSFAMCLLAAGGTVRIAPQPMKPPELLKVLQGPEITATFVPPTLLRRLLPLAEPSGDLLLPGVNYLLVSGEPLHSDEARVCREKICTNLVGYYASSEGGGISVLPATDFAEHAATVGVPTFRTEVEIVDGEGNAVASGAVGRLRYRGPGVATRFLDGDGNEVAGDDDGWFYPGDLAQLNATGHIALRGRDKDIINRGGVNIYPAEIDAVLQGHPAVSEATVIGTDDGERGQIIAAFVVADEKLTDSDLETHCREHLAPYKIPARFLRLDGLPRSGSGKIDKRALLQLL